MERTDAKGAEEPKRESNLYGKDEKLKSTTTVSRFLILIRCLVETNKCEKQKMGKYLCF